jgi:predicted nuclease of restriction endonuclease-like RecB superfamily
VLASEHSIVVYQDGKAHPDRLMRSTHAAYAEYADRLLAVYRSGAGATRRELHRSVDGVFAEVADCPARRIAAFKKLLDDASVFDTDPAGAAAELRLKVFAFAAAYHPLVVDRDTLFDSAESEVKDLVAREFGRPWKEIESALYADVMDFQPLVSFDGYPDAAALLSRYNVAQVQAALYRAERMSVTATGDFKTILRHAKLARLMHEIARLPTGGYQIDLEGPASILIETRRYGVAFARFLPALVACRGWSARAELQTPWRTRCVLELSSDDGLTSHLPEPDAFDSSVEESFAAKFGAEPRRGWRLVREGAVLHEHQTAFVPDFAFHHEDGTEVLMEIVGFWSPGYLAQKRETVRKFRKHRMLLAVPEKSLSPGAEDRDDVVAYKTALTIEPVLAALDRARAAAGS